MYIVKRIHALKDAREKRNLELVVVSVKRRNLRLETLSSTDLGDKLLHLAALVEGRTSHEFPMVEDGLREGLTSGM